MAPFSRRNPRGEDWTPPPELVAAAAQHPGGSVAEIDPSFGGDPDGYVPPEAVHGCWLVDEHGRLTGEYQENPRYGTPTDDFSLLTGSGGWLGWLGDDPAASVRASVADVLGEQVAGAILEWMQVTDQPRFLTGGRPVEGDEGRLRVTRAALAVPFGLAVAPPDGRREVLWGVFSYAAVNLDQPGERRDQVWFDLRADLDWAEEQLRIRIYEVSGGGSGPIPGPG